MQGCECGYGCRLWRRRSGRHTPYRRVGTAGRQHHRISDNATTLSTKRLALIKQAVPKLQRVAMLWNRDDLGMSMRYEASAGAARSIGVTVQPLGVRAPDDFEGVFEAMDRDPPDA